MLTSSAKPAIKFTERESRNVRLLPRFRSAYGYSPKSTEGEELLGKRANDGLNGGMMNLWESIGLLLGPFVTAGLGSYFGAYLKRKGENLATHEDMNRLVEQ